MDRVFMLPGPVKMDPRVLQAMARPAMNHRGAEFKAVTAEIRDLLHYAFSTKGEVAALSGSGTAGLEAVACGLLRKGDRVLNLVNGKFSERFHALSSVYGEGTSLDFAWGKPVDPDRVRGALEEGDYRAVTVCHNETSTGVTNPVRDIAAACRKADVLCLVDGITSVAGLEVRPDEWGIDAVVLGSQKCVAAPAGLSAIALSPRAYGELHEETSYYLDLKAHVDKMRKDDTPYTPAIPLYLAFLEALRILKEEGLDVRIARTAKLAEACRSAARALGLSLFPDATAASNTVTAIRYPDGVDDGRFRKTLLTSHGVVVAGGQSQLKGKIFRIGHMGICSFDDLRATWEAIEQALADQGVSVSRGAAVAEIPSN